MFINMNLTNTEKQKMGLYGRKTSKSNTKRKKANFFGRPNVLCLEPFNY